MSRVADEWATRDWLLEAINCFNPAEVVTFAIDDDEDGSVRFAVVEPKGGDVYIVSIASAELVQPGSAS